MVVDLCQYYIRQLPRYNRFRSGSTDPPVDDRRIKRGIAIRVKEGGRTRARIASTSVPTHSRYRRLQ